MTKGQCQWTKIGKWSVRSIGGELCQQCAVGGMLPEAQVVGLDLPSSTSLIAAGLSRRCRRSGPRWSSHRAFTLVDRPSKSRTSAGGSTEGVGHLVEAAAS